MAYTNRNFTWDFDALKRFYEKYIVKWLNSAVSWTEAQKKQARANLGFGDGDAIVTTADNASSDLDVEDDSGNVLMRLKDGHIKTKNFDSSEIFKSLMDYSKVLRMPQIMVQSIIETASGGRCTALYDEDGYPSLMYKIPKISIGALAPTLGDLTDVHPAFVVGGIEKDVIYVAVFLTSEYNGHLVSWFGLPPLGNTTVPDLRTRISDKGDGWHLETIYERSLLTLLTMNLNSENPTGNTKRGVSHLHPYEYVQMQDGGLPGRAGGSGIGLKWVNGTQPPAWTHNKQLWGIYDVIGGYHEICDLFKISYGKIYISSDNSFFKKGDNISTFESTWIDSGAAYDLQGTGPTITLSTSVTKYFSSDTYRLQSYPLIACSSDYDTLSEDMRKKLSLLLIAPKLSSADTNPVFGIDGRFGINNNKELCYGIFGGAEEYEESGLGAQITAYPIDDNSVAGHNAHSNMGSRMIYIS